LMFTTETQRGCRNQVSSGPSLTGRTERTGRESGNPPLPALPELPVQKTRFVRIVIRRGMEDTEKSNPEPYLCDLPSPRWPLRSKKSQRAWLDRLTHRFDDTP
jgi:hypothetical protein